MMGTGARAKRMGTGSTTTIAESSTKETTLMGRRVASEPLSFKIQRGLKGLGKIPAPKASGNSCMRMEMCSKGSLNNP